MKATCISPSNIAFIKYWGQKDTKLLLPYNNSISMTMDKCLTTTTVEFSKSYKKDQMTLIKEDGSKEDLGKSNDAKPKASMKLVSQMRKEAGIKENFKIVSTNNFPTASGVASSASGLSALVMATAAALEINNLIENKRELSKYIRKAGSGSATRSLYNGFTEWVAGRNDNTSVAVQLVDKDHWELVDIVAVVDSTKKKVSSSQGHTLAETSPYFKARLKDISSRVRNTRMAITEKNFSKLGALIEEEATSLHVVMMTSQPPIFYWKGLTMEIIHEVVRMREEDKVEAYWTIDAGSSVHVICQPSDVEKVQSRLKKIGVKKMIVNNNSAEAKLSDKHLF